MGRAFHHLQHIVRGPISHNFVQPASFKANGLSVRVRSAENYAHLVAAHARQATSDSLYPGLNYENLSQYLLQPYSQHYHPQSSASLSTESASAAQATCFAMLYDLAAAENERATPFISPEAFENSATIQALGTSETGHLLFLRGNPTPEWLNTIGYMCNIDPEFFLRHLDFRATAGKPDYFNLPGLPSSKSNFLRLHWTTIGSRGATFERHGRDQEEVELLRNDSARRMEHYLDETRSGHKMKICDSFVRRFAVHDGTHFSFEQDVSICINSIGNSWIGKLSPDSTVSNDVELTHISSCVARCRERLDTRTQWPVAGIAKSIVFMEDPSPTYDAIQTQYGP